MNHICLFLLIGIQMSRAQVTPRDILATRFPAPAVQAALTPRADWRPYPNTPDAWRQALSDSLRQQLIRRGEIAATKDFPGLPATLTLEYVRTTDRDRYQQASYAKRDQLLDLALAESIEGKGRFTDAILNGVWSICEESFWGVPAHLSAQQVGSGLPDVDDRIVDLFAAETGATLALTDYLVGAQLARLSPLVRPRIYRETNERIFKPIQQPDRYSYLKRGAKVNNWNPWIMTNWLTATLLLEPDAARRSQMTHAAMQGLDIYLNGLGPEGGCDEGPSYWFAAGGCVFDALELLHSATGGKVDVYADPLIRNMASYVYKMHIDQNFFVNFADADPTLRADGLMLYRFGRQIGNDTLARFGQWAYQRHGFLLNISDIPRSAGFHHRQRQLQNLLTIGQIPAYTTPFEEVQNAWFSDVQVMTARSDKGLYVATHGGHNAESHNHNDVGDFILYANGRPVIIDVGRGTYTAKTFSAQRYELWWTQSQFHNLPIINGLGQPAGRKSEARNVRYTPTEKSASLAMNLAAAYPAEAGVQSWNRLVELDRPTGAVSVRDEYTLSQKPASLQEVFMTTCSVDLSTAGQVLLTTPSQPGSRPANVLLRYDPKRWQATVEPIALTAPDDESFKTKWPNQTIKRIVLTAVNPSAKGQSVFTFSMR